MSQYVMQTSSWVERAWLPEREGYSLYIRPFMFSSGHSIGIGRPTSTTVAIMLSPVGPYFQTGTLCPSLGDDMRLYFSVRRAAQLVMHWMSQHALCH